MKLLHVSSGEFLATEVEVADSWLSRLLGLMGRESMGEGHALLLRRCSSVHTFFMRFPIDVVFLSEAGEVLDLREGVLPARICLAKSPNARDIVELPAGRARAAGLAVGDRLLMTDLDR